MRAMIEITINYKDSRGDHGYHFNVRAVPRVGEFVKINGDWYQIREVAHDLSSRHITLETTFWGRR
jgi:hypothetical protein